ncbi:MAG TPA: PVC-type heme-binding CxxCH protein [Gemmataceae bacterium]|jgi:putative membrane-bound dehydrogenase-like protein
MRRVYSLVIVAMFFAPVLVADETTPATPSEGVRPVGTDGKPLNFDFETGTLKDWTVEGEAFRSQPIKGDTVARRRGDMKSQHQGNYWIGSYERQGDRPQGALTSVAFKVTHPWASFLVGGGAGPETRVEMVRADTKKVISSTSGTDEENLRRVAVDLRPHLGKEIFIRLVDKQSGGWGHINFDDFRFHVEKPNFPVRAEPLPTDAYKFAGLPPEKSAAVMSVPEGFEVKLFAGEPDVQQPIALCLDDRGRLWVAEAYSYPIRRSDKDAKDRILIFEDTDCDGRFDKRTVFMEGLNLVSGLEVGFGGVWIGAAPYFMFVPVKPGEDKPAGKPQILLDGWHYEDTHETLNAFCWGPDGWLYGCHGVFTHSRVGKPGTPDKDRIPLNAAIWRYHPTKHVFEVFAQGTSNPWGLDFDAHGQAFIEACVIPHAFHMIQGGRYHRQAGLHFNPHTYSDIQTIADHLHWQGADPWKAISTSNSRGGGHAHCGLMIYQGGAWPEEYRGKMFMGNIHGHRLNMDVLTPKGSGFVASHGPDFVLANDAWARFINVKSGPDGNAYLLDWYDKQACHHGDPNIWDRGNGRIYKISYRGTKPVTSVDLSKQSDQELVELLLHKNIWYVSHAQRLLQERANWQHELPGVSDAVSKIAFEHPEETRRLRGLWALHVTGGLTEELICKALDDKAAHVRGWAVQLALEDGKASDTLLKKLAEMAVQDSSPVVRLYLASGMQRLPLSQRWEVLRGLLTHSADAGDHNLPLMYWYALEPLTGASPERALQLACNAKASPSLLPFTVRRITSSATPEALALVVKTLSAEEEAGRQQAILRGIHEALRGRRRVDTPNVWPTVYAKLAQSTNPEVRRQATALALIFGDTTAFAQMRQILSDPSADARARQDALTALLSARDKELAPVLQRLVGDKPLRSAALRGLAIYNDPRTPQVILQDFSSYTPEEKRDCLSTLASRAAYGKALMDAVAAKKVPASDVPAEIVRQLRNLHDKTLDERIAEVWGIVRTTAADRLRLIADWKHKVMKTDSAPDLSLGRAVFAKACQQCHTLYGSGGKVGPDITGSNRPNLDYLLENILDPSAVIPNDYKATVLTLQNGRVVTGIVRGETPAALTVATANETLTVPINEIEERSSSPTSMMPDDLLKPLSDDEVRSLIAYLRHPSQVPMLATPDNAKDFFNGKDLTGWDGDAKLWSVENGEIVGKSPGLKRNEFLKSQMQAADFRLTLKVKLTPNKENSGIQFHSMALPDGEMRGPQADAGAGWWGKLYEENGRGLLWDKSGEAHVKADEWNEYEIVAEGSRVRTYINGKLCVDLNDAALSRRGIFALQIHAGGPMEVRLKDFKLTMPR